MMSAVALLVAMGIITGGINPYLRLRSHTLYLLRPNALPSFLNLYSRVRFRARWPARSFWYAAYVTVTAAVAAMRYLD